jgi:hypothetical protein
LPTNRQAVSINAQRGFDHDLKHAELLEELPDLQFVGTFERTTPLDLPIFTVFHHHANSEYSACRDRRRHTS